MGPFRGMLLILGAVIATQSFAHEITTEQKIYVKPKQIQFKENEIFVKLGKELVTVSSIATDSVGLYVMVDSRDSYACKYGHPSPTLDGFCTFPGCPFNRG